MKFQTLLKVLKYLQENPELIEELAGLLIVIFEDVSEGDTALQNVIISQRSHIANISKTNGAMEAPQDALQKK